MNIQEEDAAGVRGIVGSHDGGLPVEHVVADGPGRAVGGGILAQVDKFW